MDPSPPDPIQDTKSSSSQGKTHLAIGCLGIALLAMTLVGVGSVVLVYHLQQTTSEALDEAEARASAVDQKSLEVAREHLALEYPFAPPSSGLVGGARARKVARITRWVLSRWPASETGRRRVLLDGLSAYSMSLDEYRWVLDQWLHPHALQDEVVASENARIAARYQNVLESAVEQGMMGVLREWR